MPDSTYPTSAPTTPGTHYSALNYAIETAKQAMSTCTIVKVTKVTTSGDVAPIGRVNVQPLVQMVDGIGQTVDHVSIFSLPYFRLGAGTKAVIMDPKVGDVGVAVFADRDISGVKNSKKVSPPGSGRRFNMADGIYISTVLADAPECYIRFTDDNKIIASPDNGTTVVTIEANKVTSAINDFAIVLRPNRIDLGQEDAPFEVVTTGGPSTKVFAVI